MIVDKVDIFFSVYVLWLLVNGDAAMLAASCSMELRRRLIMQFTFWVVICLVLWLGGSGLLGVISVGC